MARNNRKKMGSTVQSQSQPKLRITKRIVSTKRHTQGYVVGGRFVSIAEARKLASQGRINGVRVVGDHIQSINGSKRRLADLPTEIRRSRS